jgi:hypothetical protein
MCFGLVAALDLILGIIVSVLDGQNGVRVELGVAEEALRNLRAHEV